MGVERPQTMTRQQWQEERSFASKTAEKAGKLGFGVIVTAGLGSAYAGIKEAFVGGGGGGGFGVGIPLPTDTTILPTGLFGKDWGIDTTGNATFQQDMFEGISFVLTAILIAAAAYGLYKFMDMAFGNSAEETAKATPAQPPAAPGAAAA